MYDDLFWLGANVDHLSRSNQSQSYSDFKIPIKYAVYGGARLITKENLLLYDQEYLYLSILYMYQFKYHQFDIGVYWEDNPLTIGIWYRGLPIIESGYEESYVNHDALVFKVSTNVGFLSFGV